MVGEFSRIIYGECIKFATQEEMQLLLTMMHCGRYLSYPVTFIFRTKSRRTNGAVLIDRRKRAEIDRPA